MLILSFLSIFFWKLIFFRKNNRNLFLIVSVISLFILSAFRSIDEGIDTTHYVNRYHQFSALTFNDILSLYFSNDIRDPVFWLISSAIAKIGLSEQVWLSVIALFFSFSIYKFFDKYAKYPLLSLALMISLGYLGFSYTGLRQTIAISFVLLAVCFLLKEEVFKFYIFVILASLFHFSAIVVILFPFLNFRLRLIYYYIGISISLFIGVFLDSLVRSMVGIIGGAQYIGYQESVTSLNFTGVIIYMLIFIFCLYRYNYVVIKWDKTTIFYNALLLGFFFQCLSLIIAEMFRVAMYFNIFSFVLVGYALMTISNKNLKGVLYISIVFFTVVLFFIPKVT